MRMAWKLHTLLIRISAIQKRDLNYAVVASSPIDTACMVCRSVLHSFKISPAVLPDADAQAFEGADIARLRLVSEDNLSAWLCLCCATTVSHNLSKASRREVEAHAIRATLRCGAGAAKGWAISLLFFSRKYRLFARCFIAIAFFSQAIRGGFQFRFIHSSLVDLPSGV